MKSKNSRKIIVHILLLLGNYDHGISVCVDDPDFF
mgnify:CR=1 FL=1